MAITLSDLDAPTFNENAVNGAPQLIDSDVTLTGPDKVGWIKVSGMLAQDVIGILTEGRVGYDAATGILTYDGVQVGETRIAADGSFYIDLAITASGWATRAMAEDIVEHLTYANSSDAPTATRELAIQIGDLTSPPTGGASAPVLVNSYIRNGSLSLGDLDGDHDLDLVLSTTDADSGAFVFRYWENVGTTTAPSFVERTGDDNPFDDLADGYTGTLYDWDADGDLDLIFLTGPVGVARIALNVGDAQNPQFVALPEDSAELNAAVTQSMRSLAFLDYDGDGRDDLVGAMIGSGLGNLVFFPVDGPDPVEGKLFRYNTTIPAEGFLLPSPIVGAVLMDYDQDGDQDIVGAYLTGGGYWLERIDGTTTTAAWLLHPSILQTTNMPMASGDLDGDGDDDLLRLESDRIRLLTNTNSAPTKITITVTAQDEAIVGGATPDTLGGTAGADTIQGLDGDDTLDGGAGDDTLEGGDGADYLKGGAGADHLIGGRGDDIYIVDDAGDTTDETGGDGTDLVHSQISWTLGAGFENLTLAAPGRSIDATGNGLNNVLTGNSFANTLSGLGGNDTLIGGGGIDVLDGGDDDDALDGGTQDDVLLGGAGADDLIGGAGHDRLDGGLGGDDMVGGLGNDVYVVDDLADTVTELAAGGTDYVEASVNWTLGDNVEHLTLTGSVDIDGTGNALRNTITGNAGANTISGGGEIDTLSGGDGDDHLLGDDGADLLNGGADADWLEGGLGNDSLDAGTGDDLLEGGAGHDRLTGGTGADHFVFSNADIAAGTAERDQIFDLSFAEGDVIDLSGIDANTTLGGDQAFVWAVGNKFGKHAGELVIKYAAATGLTTLELDVDGDGVADFRIAINGDVTGTKANLHTGPGDTDGGWLL